jgi:ribulose-phosphate 3-epimerase
VKLSASVACIDPLRYAEIVQVLEEGGIDAFHFDFCDGHFVHTLQLFPGLLKALRPLSTKSFDVHLYCTHPSRYLAELAECGADRVVVQVEAAEPCWEVIPRVRRLGLSAGLGILPGTAIPAGIGELLSQVDLVVVNTVGPAFPGQPFDIRGLQNAAALRGVIECEGLYTEVAVDGNVCVERLPEMLGAGATHLVCGTSSIFRPGADIGSELQLFRRHLVEAIGRLASD